jgi:hypothetical protein
MTMTPGTEKIGRKVYEIGSMEWLRARWARDAKAAAKGRPCRYHVTWWQYLNLGGLGRVDRGSFATRKDAKAYVDKHSSGMSAQDKRRFKIEKRFI